MTAAKHYLCSFLQSRTSNITWPVQIQRSVRAQDRDVAHQALGLLIRCLPAEALPCFAVVASEKGVVVGRLTFTEDGDAIDCSRMGVGGKAIPPNIDKVRLLAHCQDTSCLRAV